MQPLCYTSGVSSPALPVRLLSRLTPRLTSRLTSRPRWRLLSLLLVTTLLACTPQTEIRSAEPLDVIKPPRFTVVPGRTRIERFDPPGAGAGLSLIIATSVENPNDFPIRITSVDYSLFLENDQVMRDRLEPDLLVPAEGSALLQFDIDTKLKPKPELLRAVARAFADAPLVFRADGVVEFSSLSYRFRSQRRTLFQGAALSRETVMAPQLRLNEFESRVYQLQPGVPVVQVVVDASNPGDVGYFLYGKDLELLLAGLPVAVGDMPLVPLPAGESTRIDLLFYPDPKGLGSTAQLALGAALQGIPTSLQLDGQLLMDVLGVDTFVVPPTWEVFGFVDIDRQGRP